MRVDKQFGVAGVLRGCREQLTGISTDLDVRLGGDEARQIATIASRLVEIEDFLRADAEARDRDDRRLRKVLRRATLPRGRLRVRTLLSKVRRRVRGLRTPRIGNLRQHAPRSLVVPTSYLLTDAPRPAPTISVVTPSFQQGRFLERTLYSVTSQHYPGTEYIVQDGGSSDGTVDILHRFDHLLSSWRSEPDEGQADALNRAFQRSTGEIMAYLNSDDLMLPGTLAYVAGHFAAHPEIDAIYGNRILIDEHDQKIGSWVLPPHDDRVLGLADYVPQETLFWRRSLWDAAGGYCDPSFSYALDWDLLLRMRDAGARFARLPRFLGAFRIHDEQKTTAARELGMVECIRLRKRVHGRDMPIDEVLARLRPYFRRHLRSHARHSLGALLPRSRTVVRTVPLEPWLTAAPAVAKLGAKGRSRLGV